MECVSTHSETLFMEELRAQNEQMKALVVGDNSHSTSIHTGEWARARGLRLEARWQQPADTITPATSGEPRGASHTWHDSMAIIKLNELEEEEPATVGLEN